MANHKSAIKRHKQSIKRALRNRAQRTRVKSITKDVRAAISGGDAALAEKTLRDAASVMGKASNKGAIHWKTAARRVSRLAKAVNAMQAK